MEINSYFGFIFILASLLAWVLAIFLWRLPQSNAVTRRLSALLVVESLALLTGNSSLQLLLGLEVTIMWGVLHSIADIALIILYPIFVANALPGSFLGSLRKPIVQRVWIAGCIAAYIISVTFLPLIIRVMMVSMLASVWVASVLSVRSGKTELAKRKALIFAIAFGFRDLCWILVYLAGLLWVSWIAPNEISFNTVVVPTYSLPSWLSVSLYREIVGVLYSGSTLFYIPLVTYGVLKLQLFDVDIRLKTTIRRSTLAAMFVALFFLVSEGANYFLSSVLGDVLGIIVAALLVFFLAPLRGWAEWVSSSLLKRDMQSSEYENYRKFQMYSTAVEEAMAMGDIGPSQEALLARLRESLNISTEDAKKLREDLESSAISAKAQH